MVLAESEKPFKDRVCAGRDLAEAIGRLKLNKDSTVVVGLARGGMPVAAEIADSLNLPLDVLVVRKLGVPWQPELAFGAIAPDNISVLNYDIISLSKLSESDISKVMHRELIELHRRVAIYRKNLAQLNLVNKTIILADDGLATGASMRAALKWARNMGAKNLIVAAPVASSQTCDDFKRRHYCDLCICKLSVENLNSVGFWYHDFKQVSDETVIDLLEKHAKSSFN